MKYTGTQNRQPIRIFRGSEGDYYDIPPFVPEPGFVQAVNQALSSGWPLLITGDTWLALRAVQAVCYELFGPEYPTRHFAAEMSRQVATVEDLLYRFDHDRKKRDLEYHQLDPENNPVKPLEEYLAKGALLGLLEFESQSDERPVLDIRNIHRTEKNFVPDLMELLLVFRYVRIHETGEEFFKRPGLPFMFLSAEAGFQLPDKRDYHGVIYTYELNPSREFLLENIRLEFARIIEAEPRMEIVVERFIELLELVGNFASISQGSGKGPTSYLELANAIGGKWEDICSGRTAVDAVLKELEAVIEGQKEMLESIDVSQIIPEVVQAIQVAEFRQAMEKLKVIEGRLSGEKQIELNAFLIRYHELKKKEMLETESELVLLPARNKLMLDILVFLDGFNK
jgi:hypothetical protein